MVRITCQLQATATSMELPITRLQRHSFTVRQRFSEMPPFISLAVTSYHLLSCLDMRGCAYDLRIYSRYEPG
jgi:hypothetical protein